MVSRRQAQSTFVSRKPEEAPDAGLRQAIGAIEQLVEAARGRLRDGVIDSERTSLPEGRIVGVTPPPPRLSRALLEKRQVAAHALAHLTTALAAARRLAGWAEQGGEAERRIADVYAGELYRALRGGVGLGPAESVSLAELELGEDEVAARLGNRALAGWAASASSSSSLAAIAEAALLGGTDATAADGDAVRSVRAEIQAFAASEVAPRADEIRRLGAPPPALLAAMERAGAFALAVPAAYGGEACDALVTAAAIEELARASSGAALLASAAAVTAELLVAAGTEGQRRAWLERIAGGDAIPAIAIAEPGLGLDLDGAKARAERVGGGDFAVFGRKTRVLCGARADLLILLLRTHAEGNGAGGLGLFVAPKQRGRAGRDFLDEGLSGERVGAVSGVSAYELVFDGFGVGAEGLLGGRDGEAPAALRAALAFARILAAARAVGVAQASLDHALARAHEATRGGGSLPPRAVVRLGRTIVRVHAARRLTMAAARTRVERARQRAGDGAARGPIVDGGRGDVEASMAKLLAAEVAAEAALACAEAPGGEDGRLHERLGDARAIGLCDGSREAEAEFVARRLLE